MLGRTGLRRHALVATLALALLAAPVLPASMLGVAPASAARDGESPAPMIWQRDFADPSVVEFYDGYLAVGTGPVMPRVRSGGSRGPWREMPTPLTAYPAWAVPADVWAPHLQRVADGTWVLYYSALVAGLAPGSRCIGAATAPTATGPFTPAGDAPLVCPPTTGTLPASDQLLNRPGDLPASGVIDASVFTERDGRLYLLYKTQGLPSSIRMVLLTPDGLGVSPGKRSRMLLRSNDTVENPALVHQGAHYVLFTSEGYFGDCDYRTTWRKSRQKWRWHAHSTNFLGPEITGLCGPGGADVVVPRHDSRVRMFFHGWLCNATPQPCPRQFRRTLDGALLPVRGMYGVLLDWGRSDAPEIASYLVPR